MSFPFQPTFSNHLEGDAGSTAAACRNFMVRLEDTFRKSFVEKTARYHSDEISRKSNFDIYREDAALSLDGLMNVLH
jgi:hypothetical protein